MAYFTKAQSNPQFVPPNFNPNPQYPRIDVGNTLESVFDTYMRAKQAQRGENQDAIAAEARANAERDRAGAAMLQYGFDPRQVTPEVLARSQPGMTPQGPAAPGMLSPEQTENPLFGQVRAYLEKKKSAASMATQGNQADIDLKRSQAAENEAQAGAYDRLIPRPPKGGKTATNQDLTSAMELYETAKEGLISGLGGSETGQIIGRLPAMTAKQQIAKGSVAAMAPVLKQIFRTAGEGVFTDRDQQLLLDMIPTRTELPEARQAMIANIDAIVKAKIKSGMRNTQAAPETPVDAAPINLTGAKAARLAELRAKRGR